MHKNEANCLLQTPEAATPVVVVNDVSEDKTEIETKEKTPETPVTEPITNGSSTPESPKVDMDNSIKASPESEKPEPKPEEEPVQLALNGLSLEEQKIETLDVESKIAEIVESKIEEQAIETMPEIVPTPENPVKEVCVDQMPLIEPTPPPLPANPPPSSVASFAATTMAPELADASLPNTADNAIPASSPTPPPIQIDEVHVDPPEVVTNIEYVNDTSSPTETVENVVTMQIDESEKVLNNIPTVEITHAMETDNITLVNEINANKIDCFEQLDNKLVISPVENQIVEPESLNPDLDVVNVAHVDEPSQPALETSTPPLENDNTSKVEEDIDSVEMSEIPDGKENLEIISNHIDPTNDAVDVEAKINIQAYDEKLDNTSDLNENLPEVVECNGNVQENDDNDRTDECAIETTSAFETVVDSEKDSIAEQELPVAPHQVEAEAAAETPATTPPPSSPLPPMEPLQVNTPP